MSTNNTTTKQASDEDSGRLLDAFRQLFAFLSEPSNKINHTQNSLLCSIAGIHGRFLSIICGIILAFYMYNYKQAETCKQQLDDLRLKVARMMIIPGFRDPCEPDPQIYFKNDVFDIEKITRDFYEQIGNKLYPGIETILMSSGIDIQEAYGYEQRVKRLVSLISIVSNVYPYSTRSPRSNPGIQSVMYSDIRKDWTHEWQHDVIKLNFNLMLLLQQRRGALDDLLARYVKARLKDEIAQQQDSNIQEFNIHKFLGQTFHDSIEQFFAIVERINSEVVPELNDYSFRLERYQRKSFGPNVIVPLILLLIFGLFLPLVWAMKPVYTIVKPICTLIIPLVFYIWLLIILL